MHRCPTTDTAVGPRGDVSRSSVPARPRWGRLESLRALVAEEVVAGEDVVDLKAFRAGVALTDVALEEGVVANDAASASIAQEVFRSGAAARLAGKVVHRRSTGSAGDTALLNGEGFTNYSTRAGGLPGSEADMRRYNECSCL